MACILREEVVAGMAGPTEPKGLRAFVTRLRRKWKAGSIEERNALRLYASSVGFGATQAGIIAYLSVFLVRLGASAQQIGLLSSVPAAVSMVLMIPAGFVAERFRNQVRLRTISGILMRSTTLLMALAPLVFGLSAIPNVAVGLWALRTGAMAVALPPFMTVMSDAIAPQHRSRVNGTRWAIVNVVSVVLAPLFGRMLDVVRFPENYQILFAISFIGGIGNIYFFSQIKVPPLKVRERTAQWPDNLGEGLRSYISSIKDSRKFVLFLLGTVAFRVAFNMPLPLYTVFWVNELGVTDGLIGIRETAGYSALVLGYLAWATWAPRMQRRNQLAIVAVLLGLYSVATGLIPSAPWIVPVALIWGFATSGVNIGLFNIMLASVPTERMPRLSAVLNLVSSAAATIGPLLGVGLSQATSTRTALLIIGGLTILATIPFRVLGPDE
jgi:MFS family permease